MNLLKGNIFSRIFNFYYQGFKSMTWGKTLWIIILVKLFIIFFVLKLFFFSNELESNFNTDEDRSSYILEKLTNKTFDND